MRARLAAQQTALLDVLHLRTPDFVALHADNMPAISHFSDENPAATVRGLRAYRAHAQAQSVKALQVAYSTLARLIGLENFAPLAHSFWRDQPPTCGDLAQWGQGLAEYLVQVAQLQDLLAEHAYLPDVARVEWALHAVATAPDVSLDGSSFQLLASHDPARLRLVLSPGCFLLCSDYPVVALLQWHDLRLADAGADVPPAITKSEPQAALVWRQGFRPMLALAEPGSRAMLQECLQGKALTEALQAALAQSPDFDFSAWLQMQVHSGVVCGVIAV